MNRTILDGTSIKSAYNEIRHLPSDCKDKFGDIPVVNIYDYNPTCNQPSYEPLPHNQNAIKSLLELIKNRLDAEDIFTTENSLKEIV